MTEPVAAELQAFQPDYRLEALRLAVQLYAPREHDDFTGQTVIHAAGEFTKWLTARPARLALTAAPTTFSQADPGRNLPTRRTGDNMSVTMTDDQQVSYAVEAEDDKGAQVSDTLTWSSDDAGAVLTVTPSADGMSCVFAAVAPGSATVTVTDGTLSASDLITVTAGAAASLVLTPGTPSAEAAAAPVTPSGTSN
jgi:hypothetical protein